MALKIWLGDCCSRLNYIIIWSYNSNKNASKKDIKNFVNEAKLTNTSITPLLVPILTRTLIRPLSVAAYLLASMCASVTFVYIATVGAILVDFIASPTEALVRALRVLAQLFARRRSHTTLVYVGAHVSCCLIATTAHAAEAEEEIEMIMIAIAYVAYCVTILVNITTADT